MIQRLLDIYCTNSVCFVDAENKPELNKNATSISRCWCDPHEFSEIIGCDIGAGFVYSHMLKQARDCDRVSAQQMATFVSRLNSNTLLIIEAAHLGRPQKNQSLAQPWTEEQILEIYKAADIANVTICLFPEDQTSKARRWSANNAPAELAITAEKSTDVNDARALAYFVGNRNSISLLRPRKDFEQCSKRHFGNLVSRCSNIVLNVERNANYSGVAYPKVACIASRLLGERLYGLQLISKPAAAFSVASLVCTELEGRPVRFVYKGRSLGANAWMRYVMKMTPCHRRGSVARSNIMRHAFRSFAAKYGESEGVRLKHGARLLDFSKHDEDQSRVVQMAKREARLQLKTAYQQALELCREFEPYEILSKEPTNGR